MKALALAVIVVLVTSRSATGKCAFHEYTFEGTVLNEANQRPIGGAQIFIFLDDYESTLAGGYKTTYPDFFTTPESGKIKATSYFPSYRTTSFFRGDVCDNEPERAEAIVTAKGFISKRIHFKMKDLKSKKLSRWQYSVSLPSIFLRSGTEAQIKELGSRPPH